MFTSCAPPTRRPGPQTGMCPDWESNQRLFVSQTGAQSTELHQPGLVPHVKYRHHFFFNFANLVDDFKILYCISLLHVYYLFWFLLLQISCYFPSFFFCLLFVFKSRFYFNCIKIWSYAYKLYYNYLLLDLFSVYLLCCWPIYVYLKKIFNVVKAVYFPPFWLLGSMQ